MKLLIPSSDDEAKFRQRLYCCFSRDLDTKSPQVNCQGWLMNFKIETEAFLYPMIQIYSNWAKWVKEKHKRGVLKFQAILLYPKRFTVPKALYCTFG